MRLTTLFKGFGTMGSEEGVEAGVEGRGKVMDRSEWR